MKPRWRRLGRIFKAEGQRPWMASHTADPVAMRLGENLYRIYFATRDASNHPSIAFVEIDIDSPTQVLRISENPVLTRGSTGFFDDNGVYPSCFIEEGGELLMLYTGRMNHENRRYGMAIGLAESRDGGLTFRRRSLAPLLDRGPHDPWAVGTPWVMREESFWRMWYLSGIGWNDTDGTSRYHIKQAVSHDMMSWRRSGHVSIDFMGGETNIARPTLLFLDGAWHMWFAKMALGRYDIGYATSLDGEKWNRRDDELGLVGSGEGWDGASVAYPACFRHEDKIYLLYSGEGFGREGFGIAVLEQ